MNAAIAIAAMLAAEQPSCGPHDALVARFKDTFQEVPVWRGATQKGDVMEILQSPAGTWTLLMVGRDMNACFIASGHAGTTPKTLPPGRDA
jgi:hypothetical protein